MLQFLFIALITSGVVWNTVYLHRLENKLHAELDEVEKLANDAVSIDELKEVWNKLMIANKKAFHRVFFHRVRVIKAIIDTKYSMMKEKINLEKTV